MQMQDCTKVALAFVNMLGLSYGCFIQTLTLPNCIIIYFNHWAMQQCKILRSWDLHLSGMLRSVGR